MEFAIFFLAEGTGLYFIHRLLKRYSPKFCLPGLLMAGILFSILIQVITIDAKFLQPLEGIDVHLRHFHSSATDNTEPRLAKYIFGASGASV